VKERNRGRHLTTRQVDNNKTTRQQDNNKTRKKHGPIKKQEKKNWVLKNVWTDDLR
jgi:hypothetical protein